MFSVLVIRLRSLRLLRVSGIVMRLRMFLLLITFLKASHSFRNRLLVICKNAYLFRSEERRVGKECRSRWSRYHYDKIDFMFFFFSSRRRHTRSVSAFLLNRSSDLMKDVFRSGDSSKKFKIAEGQWYRYAPSYVSPAYHLLEGFPFIQEPPSGDLQERVLIRHHDYDQCFQSVQLLQWNSQVKFNVTVYRNLPTTRDSIMTS